MPAPSTFIFGFRVKSGRPRKIVTVATMGTLKGCSPGWTVGSGCSRRATQPLEHASSHAHRFCAACAALPKPTPSPSGALFAHARKGIPHAPSDGISVETHGRSMSPGCTSKVRRSTRASIFRPSTDSGIHPAKQRPNSLAVSGFFVLPAQTSGYLQHAW